MDIRNLTPTMDEREVLQDSMYEPYIRRTIEREQRKAHSVTPASQDPNSGETR